MFGIYQTGGLAVLNALARPGDYHYQEHRFNGIPKSVVSATNYFLDKVYTEGPVLTIFTPLLTITTGTCLARKTTTRCPCWSTLCAVMRPNFICCTVQMTPAFGEAIQRA